MDADNHKTPDWQARTIYTPPRYTFPQRNGAFGGSLKRAPSHIDIVPDRIEHRGDFAGTDLHEWIKVICIPTTRRWTETNNIKSDSYDTLTLTLYPERNNTRHYVFTATPNGSHGYLYMKAWIEPGEQVTI